MLPAGLVNPTMYDPLVDMGIELRMPPVEFRVFSIGDNDTEKGVFVFDERAAEQVMAAWADRKIDLTIDYEHQSMHDPPIEAPNAATRWVPQVRNGELWATEVKWTDRASGYLMAGEYRYFSPAFEFDPDSRRVTKVINLALTNNPAMRGIRPLVAASARKGNDMNWEEECKRLKAEVEKLTGQLSEKDQAIAKLTAEATNRTEAQREEEAVAADVTAALSLPASARARERAQATRVLVSFRDGVRGLTGAKSDHEALGLLAGWKDSQSKIAALNTRVEELEQEKLKAEFDRLLDQAGGADKKLPPAKREEITQVALKASGGKYTPGAIETARAFLSIRGPVLPDPHTPPRAEGGGGDVHPLQSHIRDVMGRNDKQQPTAAK